jgi:predicted ATP-dependent endonuclease of OLD family
MQIKEVVIENFKSFKYLELNSKNAFEKANMIFGYNNSGKSSLIKFIHLVFMKKYGGHSVQFSDDNGTIKTEMRIEEGAMNFWEGLIINSPFIYRNNDDSKAIKFNIKFAEEKESLPEIKFLTKLYNAVNVFEINGIITYEKYSVSNISLNKVTLNDTIIYSRKDKTQTYFSSIPELKGDSKIFEDLLSTFNDSVSFIDSDRYFVEEKEDATKTNLNPKNFKNWLFQLYLNPEQYDKFIELTSSFEDFKPSSDKEIFKANLANYPLNKIDLGFVKRNGLIDILLKNNGRYPISSYGTGIQQIFYILAKIFNSSGKILIIEELELNLSPEYQIELLTFLYSLIDAKKINQLLFTSHSNYMVDHFNVTGFFVVSIDNEGTTNVEKLSHGQARSYFDNQLPQKRKS